MCRQMMLALVYCGQGPGKAALAYGRGSTAGLGRAPSPAGNSPPVACFSECSDALDQTSLGAGEIHPRPDLFCLISFLGLKCLEGGDVKLSFTYISGKQTRGIIWNLNGWAQNMDCQ